MKSNEYIQALLTSTQALVDKTIAENKFSSQNNFQATIVENPVQLDNGAYSYKALNNITNTQVTLYSNTDTYKVNEQVLVLNAGSSGNYYILGYYFDSQLNTVVQYEDPEANILKTTAKIESINWQINEDQNLIINSSGQEVKIYSDLVYFPFVGKPHDRVYLETYVNLDLFDNEDDYYKNAFLGNYGFQIELYENITNNKYVYEFDSNNMYGNMYCQNRERQKIVFDISALSHGVKYAQIIMYSKNNFKNFYKENYFLEQEIKGEEKTQIIPKEILLTDILINTKVYLCYDINNLNEKCEVYIDVDNSQPSIYNGMDILTYDPKKQETLFTDLYAQVILYNKTLNKYEYWDSSNIENNPLREQIELRWYRYIFGENENDHYGGDNWALMDREIKEDSYIVEKEKRYLFEQELLELNKDLSENKFKCVAVIGGLESYSSNEIVYYRLDDNENSPLLMDIGYYQKIPEIIRNDCYDFEDSIYINSSNSFRIYPNYGELAEKPLIILQTRFKNGDLFYDKSVDTNEANNNPETYVKLEWKIPNGENSLFEVVGTYIDEDEKTQTQHYADLANLGDWGNLSSKYYKYELSSDEKYHIYTKYYYGENIDTQNSSWNDITIEQLAFSLKGEFKASDSVVDSIICNVYGQNNELKASYEQTFVFGKQPTLINGYNMTVKYYNPNEQVLSENLEEDFKCYLGATVNIENKLYSRNTTYLSVGLEYLDSKLNLTENEIECENWVFSGLDNNPSSDIDHKYITYNTTNTSATIYNTTKINFEGLTGQLEAQIIADQTSIIQNQVLIKVGLKGQIESSKVSDYPYLSEQNPFSGWVANYNILIIRIPKYNIVKYFPIVIATYKSSNYIYMKNYPQEIIYNNNGKLYNTLFSLQGYSNIEIKEFGHSRLSLKEKAIKSNPNQQIWKEGWNWESIKNNAGTIQKNEGIIQFNMYPDYLEERNCLCNFIKIGGQTTTNLGNDMTISDWGKNSALLLIPIYIGKEINGSKVLSDWDGKTKIEPETGEISGEYLIVGNKNKEEQFSGCYLGITDTLPNNSNSQISGLNGIVGYKNGNQVFCLDNIEEKISLGEQQGVILSGKKDFENLLIQSSQLFDDVDEKEMYTNINISLGKNQTNKIFSFNFNSQGNDITDNSNHTYNTFYNNDFFYTENYKNSDSAALVLTSKRIDTGTTGAKKEEIILSTQKSIFPNTTNFNIINVSGAATFGNTLNVSGAATFGNTLNVSGAATFNENTILNGDIKINGKINSKNEAIKIYSTHSLIDSTNVGETPVIQIYAPFKDTNGRTKNRLCIEIGLKDLDMGSGAIASSGYMRMYGSFPNSNKPIGEIAFSKDRNLQIINYASSTWE